MKVCCWLVFIEAPPKGSCMNKSTQLCSSVQEVPVRYGESSTCACPDPVVLLLGCLEKLPSQDLTSETSTLLQQMSEVNLPRNSTCGWAPCTRLKLSYHIGNLVTLTCLSLHSFLARSSCVTWAFMFERSATSCFPGTLSRDRSDIRTFCRAGNLLR